MLSSGDEFAIGRDTGFLLGPLVAPGPSVSESNLRNDVERCCLWTAVVRCDTEENLLLIISVLRRLDKYIPVAVVTESPLALATTTQGRYLTRRLRCPATGIQAPLCCGSCFPDAILHREISSAGTCTNTSCNCAWACCRGSSGSL